MWFFFAILSFCDIVAFSNFCVKKDLRFFPKCFRSFLFQKWCCSLKMHNANDRSYCIPEFFFVRFLVFELWSFLYLTVVNSELGLEKFCKYDSDANQFRLGSSILKHARSRFPALVVGTGGEAPIKKIIIIFFNSDQNIVSTSF